MNWSFYAASEILWHLLLRITTKEVCEFNSRKCHWMVKIDRRRFQSALHKVIIKNI